VRSFRPPRALRIALLLAVTLAVGLASRRVRLGVALWDKSLGDVLYAVAVVFALALALPRVRPAIVAAIGLCVCLAIECFQLTGVPLALARQHGWVRLVLGTTFAWHDVACYVFGAGFALLVLRGRVSGQRLVTVSASESTRTTGR
jgi:hypothetical protein